MAQKKSTPEKAMGIKEIRACVVNECFRRRHDGTCLRGRCLRTDMMKKVCIDDEANALLTDDEMKKKAEAMGILPKENEPVKAESIK